MIGVLKTPYPKANFDIQDFIKMNPRSKVFIHEISYQISRWMDHI